MIKENKDSKGNQISNHSVIKVSECNNPQIVITGDKLSQPNFDNENSIIAFTLDTFNFKKFLETIAHSQNRFKITQNLINTILLLIFLTVAFLQAGVLTLQRSPMINILIGLSIVAVLEFLGSNTSIFKVFFDNDLKTKRFIDGLPFLSNNEIKEQIEVRKQTFSPDCLDYFIEGLRDVNKYSQDVVYTVLNSQFLRKQNLDLLFSPEIIKNISPKIILRLLFIKRNTLTQNNMLNIYYNYSDNQDVMKMLIATQEDSYFLIKLYPEVSELSEYYQRYQKEKKHLDWILNLIPINELYKIIIRIAGFIFLSLMGLCVLDIYTGAKTNINGSYLLQEIFVKFLGISFISLIIVRLVLRPLYYKIYDYYYRRMLSNIIIEDIK